ncbi:hypothetical protein AYO49_04775 [Verrucomicrobiaceae bacterium SCGC AG-212-N21]|nr:hypothetical protein AYO49_04775 [Verrucomicrobiaceae bacterium SCGC AG-212-N21]
MVAMSGEAGNQNANANGNGNATVNAGMPYDASAECAILQTCFAHPEEVRDILEQIPSRAFYHVAHRTLYEAISHMEGEGLPIEYLAASSWLQEQGLMDRIGGHAELASIALSVGVGRWEYYRDILFNKWTARQAIGIGQELQREVQSTQGDASPLLLAMAERMSSLAGTQGRQVNLGGLDARRIRLSTPPPRPVPLFKYLDQVVGTAGNIGGIQAQAKHGKTGLMTALQASILAADLDHEDADCLGFTAYPSQGRAVIGFDTEQSEYHSFENARRVAARSGCEELPDNYRLYRLNDVPAHERRRYLAAEMKRAHEECGGIHSVFIDGIADLIPSPNDEEVANGLIDELVRLATRYRTLIWCVLHENPGAMAAASGKTRGHLGSQLERKAESNLRVVKAADGVSTIYTERSRTANIPKDEGVCFSWSETLRMHCSVKLSAAVTKEAKKREEQRPVVDEAFEEHLGGAITWGDLHARVVERCHMPQGTAERRIREWLKLGLIAKSSTGSGYIKAT